MNDQERRREKALARYQVVSGYLALDPPRGQRRRVAARGKGPASYGALAKLDPTFQVLAPQGP